MSEIVASLGFFVLVGLWFGVVPLLLAGEMVYLVFVVGMNAVFVIPLAVAEISPPLISIVGILDKREKNQMIDGVVINEQPDAILKRNKNVKTPEQIINDYYKLCNKEVPQRQRSQS